MKCIGQNGPDVLPEHVHILCTRQLIRQGLSVRSNSYSAVYFTHSGLLYISHKLLFYRLGLLQVMRTFISCVDPLIIFYVIYVLNSVEVSVKINATISYIEFLREYPRKYHERTDFDN